MPRPIVPTVDIHCDADDCYLAAGYECACSRCAHEPTEDERYHACEAHREDVAVKHRRVRGREPVWEQFLT
jgi:hypothetical protein